MTPISIRLLVAVVVAAVVVGRAWGGYTLTHVERSGSDIYPGIDYCFDIYAPDGYTGLEPACLVVGLDGVLCRAPQVMDSLIAAGSMPMTLGIFLQPGVVHDADGNVLRYARSSQFDATDDAFARFLESEVLPAASSTTLPGNRKVNLSARGSDRAIFGLSSGGIAAFNAAWHRPDLFARVFSGVGTFVAMRGGNDLAALVRKAEPRPLRVFLQDGTADAWNPLFGHWYDGNRLLASALDFAGYDAAYDWGDGGHNTLRATEVFPLVMEWLWAGWPAEPQAGATANNLLAATLIAGEWWQACARPALPPQPAVAVYPDSTLVAAPHESSNQLWQWMRAADGSLALGQRFYWLHSTDNALLHIGPMAFDGAGLLWVVTNAGLQVCDQNGRVRGILALPCPAGDIDHIVIGDGTVIIAGSGSAFARRLNVKAPTPGVRPPSQGQG